jgi:ankyrin repeat protein
MNAAANNHNPDVIATLLKAGGDVNAQDASGETPLMLAAKFNPIPAVITTLLNAGSNIEACDLMGHTPLIIAARSNQNPKVTVTILEAGGNAKARDKAKKTAFDYAKSNYSLRGTDALKQLEEASK